MEPKAQIGDVVRKGQLLALTGGKPVYSQLDGVIRGMLQEGVQVKKGLKIGDVDPRKDKKLCYLISDKANEIGSSVVKTVEARLSDKDYAMILLAAGSQADTGTISCWRNWMEGRCSNIPFVKCMHFHCVHR